MISPEWLAGFFDGEGNVGITVSGKRRHCIVRLSLVNTNYEILQEIQIDYGGYLSRRENKNKPHWKPFCSLTWTNCRAAEFLKIVGPHIVLKKQQVALANEFLALRESPNRFELGSKVGLSTRQRPFVRKIRPEILTQELEMKQAMHILNRKGVHAIQ